MPPSPGSPCATARGGSSLLHFAQALNITACAGNGVGKYSGLPAGKAAGEAASEPSTDRPGAISDVRFSPGLSLPLYFSTMPPCGASAGRYISREEQAL